MANSALAPTATSSGLMPRATFTSPESGILGVVSVTMYGSGGGGTGGPGDPYEADWGGLAWDVFVWECVGIDPPTCGFPFSPDPTNSFATFEVPSSKISISDVVGIYVHTGDVHYNQRVLSFDLTNFE